MSTTKAVIRQDSAKVIGALLWDGTMTGGSATTIIHTGNRGLRDSGISDDLFAGAYALITSGSDIGIWKMIGIDGYDPAAGQVTVGDPWSTGGANGTTYEILTGLDPTQWGTVINDTLATLRRSYRSPLTLVTDGDMETSGVTNWSVTNATRAKITSGAFINGTQALEVTNTSANGYAQCANIPCNPGDSFLAWANYKATTGSAKLQAWDVTGGASLASDQGSDSGLNNEGGMIPLAFAAGSSTKNIAMRLIGVESNAVIDWDDIIVMRVGRKRYPAPSWVTEKDMLKEVHIRNGVRPNEFSYVHVGWPLNVEADYTGVSPFTVVLPSGTPTPLYFVGDAPYAALTADTDTTSCPAELLKYAVASAALELMGKSWERIGAATMGMDKAEVNRHKIWEQRRLSPRTSRPIGEKMEWVATA